MARFYPANSSGIPQLSAGGRGRARPQELSFELIVDDGWPNNAGAVEETTGKPLGDSNDFSAALRMSEESKRPESRNINWLTDRGEALRREFGFHSSLC